MCTGVLGIDVRLRRTTFRRFMLSAVLLSRDIFRSSCDITTKIIVYFFPEAFLTSFNTENIKMSASLWYCKLLRLEYRSKHFARIVHTNARGVLCTSSTIF